MSRGVNMSDHSDHRQRVKARFRKEGLDGFDEIHVLELLLFYCIPRRDTNVLAHQLLEHFGSLTQVLEAPVEELEKVPGVGEHASTLISLITEISRYYLVSKTTNMEILRTIRECGEYMVSRFMGRRDEMVFLLCLDAKCKVLCCKEAGRGSVNSANVSIRRIVEMALAVNATTVVLAHNHPSGIAVPSNEDILTTRKLAVALDGVDIMLADHIIVADDDFVSLVESNLYRPEECRMIV